MIIQGAKLLPVREAILHCAAVPSGWYYRHTNQQMVDTIRDWHLSRGWSDIGYHYVITPEGVVLPGRPVERQGAHTMGHNQGTLGILLIERSQITHVGQFSDWFTTRQRQSVKRLVRLHGISKVSGHNDYAARICPGFKVVSDEFR